MYESQNINYILPSGVGYDAAKESLNSTVHGAGRVMSRTQAAGRLKKVIETRTKPDGSTYEFRTRVRAKGLIDWPAVQVEVKTAGIELRGSGADEAPGAYKKLDEVLDEHKASINIPHRLKPIGVAMAGSDVFDPYKD